MHRPPEWSLSRHYALAPRDGACCRPPPNSSRAVFATRAPASPSRPKAAGASLKTARRRGFGAAAVEAIRCRTIGPPVSPPAPFPPRSRGADGGEAPLCESSLAGRRLAEVAPLCESAIEQIIIECERRVANASPVFGAAPPFAVSTHAFDAARPRGEVWVRDGLFSLLREAKAPRPGARASTVQQLVERIGADTAMGDAGPMVLIGAMVYLSRMTLRCTSEYASVTAANWYRLTAIAILIATKMYVDGGARHWNARIAAAAGLPARAVGRLELDFLFLIDFDLLIREEEVEAWAEWMAAVARRRGMSTPLRAFVLGRQCATPSCATPLSSLAGDEACLRPAAAPPVASGGPPSPTMGDAERLFSIVHAPPEPRTPPRLRQLSPLPAAPTPPAAHGMSPVAFFRRHPHAMSPPAPKRPAALSPPARRGGADGGDGGANGGGWKQVVSQVREVLGATRSFVRNAPLNVLRMGSSDDLTETDERGGGGDGKGDKDDYNNSNASNYGNDKDEDDLYDDDSDCHENRSTEQQRDNKRNDNDAFMHQDGFHDDFDDDDYDIFARSRHLQTHSPI